MKTRTFSRRFFLQSGLAGAAGIMTGGCATSRATTARLEGVFPSYIDETTGAKVHVLTPGEPSDQVVYQTHPMWTPGMTHLVFLSKRSGDALAPHVLEMKTGTIRPLLGAAGRVFSLGWRGGQCYYLEGNDLCVIDVAAGFEGRDKGRKVASMPPEYAGNSGGMSVSADEGIVYVGTTFEEKKRWGILALDVKTATWRTHVSVDFLMGHVQASPFKTNEVMFCHETGGDAPQRTWFSDGVNPHRTFYKETYNEWVTHEVWWAPDKILFTVWPYDAEHREKPHGVAWATLGSDVMNVVAQYPAWHTHGTWDGRWVMGDDFSRNIWLMRMPEKERRLLTQGHQGKGFTNHPHGSFTPDKRGIVFTSSKQGSEDVVLVELPKWDQLARMA